jgi:hypothetical protein
VLEETIAAGSGELDEEEPHGEAQQDNASKSHQNPPWKRVRTEMAASGTIRRSAP